MFCSPDYNPLCSDTIMNNTSLEAQEYSIGRIYLQYIFAPDLFS